MREAGLYIPLPGVVLCLAHLFAEVRLRPRPPALVLIRKTKVLLSSLLKSSTFACRSACAQHAAPRVVCSSTTPCDACQSTDVTTTKL